MDAVKFLKEASRMCKANNKDCHDCPLWDEKSLFCNDLANDAIEMTDPQRAVHIVEKWASGHPTKTRQSEFLKMFPNARIDDDGVVDIATCIIDKTYAPCSVGDMPCNLCRKEYWLEEIE